MVFKSSLLTAGDSKPSNKPPHNKFSTAYKIAQAAKKAVPKNTPREAPSKRKPQSLPHPDEFSAALKRSKTEDKSKNWARLKPLTTRQKIKKAEAMKRAKGGTKTKTMAEIEGLSGRSKVQTHGTAGGTAKGKTGKEPRTFFPGLCSVLDDQEESSINLKRQEKPKESVLYRPTKRAEKWRSDNAPVVLTRPQISAGAGTILRSTGNRLTADVRMSICPSGNESNTKTFKLLSLPAELRTMIWAFAVVETKVFIWPDTPIGAEQPDLAMTCRQIRQEVLPVFYARNTFAIDIPAFTARDFFGEVQPSRGLTAVKKWGIMLQRAGWLKFVNKYVFAYAGAWWPATTRKDGSDDSCIVAVTLSALETVQSYPQVHQDARCLLSGCDEYGKCIEHHYPKWLHNAVISASTGVDVYRQADKVEFVIALAQRLKERLTELASLKCERARSSIE